MYQVHRSINDTDFSCCNTALPKIFGNFFDAAHWIYSYVTENPDADGFDVWECNITTETFYAESECVNNYGMEYTMSFKIVKTDPTEIIYIR